MGKELTKAEYNHILEETNAAWETGDIEKGVELSKQLPLAPHLAKAAKKLWGKEFLLESGFDLSAAEAEYGCDWLQN